jgi:uncharacterized protein (TIGR00297 family)
LKYQKYVFSESDIMGEPSGGSKYNPPYSGFHKKSSRDPEMVSSKDWSVAIRVVLAALLAIGLAAHGKKKKSLDNSGCLAAIVVGFVSFAVSYRFGLILVLFYYSSSKFTKLKEDVKSKLEDEYAVGGQRNWIQVLANSVIATVIAGIYYYACGEDTHIDFTDHNSIGAILWILYVAHYACANADTWASEIGILSKSKPRLVTTLFIREVPHGTNGGMSLLGTAASGAGGAFIGLIFWVMSFISVDSTSSQYNHYRVVGKNSQAPMIVVGLVAGLLGSLLDSILGATVQATYYSKERCCIVKRHRGQRLDELGKDVVVVSGVDILTNEEVNFYSIALTCVAMVWLGPMIFCLLDSSQCT